MSSSASGPPGSVILSLNQLPLEILQAIYLNLDTPDILRLRRVSRYLNDVSHYREIWKDVYRNAEFVHPPGPFPSQSSHDLEKVLVRSFRLHRNLHRGDGTAKMEAPTRKLREILYPGLALRASLVFGRFLLVAFREYVHCYDLDLPDSRPSIIFRPICGVLRSFHCVSAIDCEGCPFACVVLNEATKTTRQISICLLHVGEQSNLTLQPLHEFEHNQFDIDTVDLGPRIIVIQGRVGSDRCADWRLVALDVQTRTQFLLPSFTHVMLKVVGTPDWRANQVGSPKSISTSTHVLLASSFYTQGTGWSTFFQAFSIPPARNPHTRCHSTPTTISLSASHQGICPGITIRLGGAILLRDAVLDSSTQDVLIAIRVLVSQHSGPDGSRPKYGTLRLSTASTPDDNEVGTVTFKLLGPLGHHGASFLHPSFHGIGRVFYALVVGTHRIIAALEYDLRASGNDEDHEHVAKITEYPSILGFSTPCTLLDYDPYAGRICLGRSATMHSGVIEIVDVTV